MVGTLQHVSFVQLDGDVAAPGDHYLRLVPAVAPRVGQQLLQGGPYVGLGGGQAGSVGRDTCSKVSEPRPTSPPEEVREWLRERLREAMISPSLES